MTLRSGEVARYVHSERESGLDHRFDPQLVADVLERILEHADRLREALP